MNILLATPAAVVRDDNTHPNLMDSGTYNDGSQDWWLYLCSEDVTADYPGSKLIGKWNQDGSVLVTATDGDGNPTAWHPIDADYLNHIRPMGNDTGFATDQLDYHGWLGGGQRYMQETPAPDTLATYPADLQPYSIRMTRTFIDDDDFPATPWGFQLVIEFADPSRAPDARSIGVYDDAECTQYLWTPGAFVWTDTGEVDENGDPIFQWQIDCPVGQRTADRTDWHVANLFGSAQEGKYSMLADQDTFLRNFWDRDQGGGNAWLDSGQTVAGNAGTITLVSGDKTEFPIGGRVRIEGLEGDVNSYWAGGEGLEILPTRSYTIGAVIEVWGTTETVTDQSLPVTYNSENVTDAGT